MELRIVLPAVLAILTLQISGFSQGKSDFEPHPLAPSLPLLSDEEYKKMADIVDRFILYDTGRLKGAAGRKALADFNALGPESIPVLINGFNKSVRMQASCPVTFIGRKLRKFIIRTQDGKLLDYIRESSGIGGEKGPYRKTINDLKVACIYRKTFLQRTGILSTNGGKGPRLMTNGELVQAAGKAKGTQLKGILAELYQRKSEDALSTFVAALERPDRGIRQYAQNLLLQHLSRDTEKLKQHLQDSQPIIRAASAYVIGVKGLPYRAELTKLLEDESEMVRQNARIALKRLR